MATKYYHAENCNRRFENRVEFQPYSLLGGTWNGVFATDDEDQQAYLSGLAGNPTTAVRELTEDEYQRRIGQTTGIKDYSPTPEPFKAKPVPAPNATVRIAAKAGVVVREPEPKPEEAPVATAKPLENVNEALQVDKVEKAGEPVKAPAPAKAKKPNIERPTEGQRQ